jgi:hypothetical protein
VRTLDLRGQQYGLLTVFEYKGKTSGSRPEHIWLCICKCGKQKTIRQNNLRSGHTKSCGCQIHEVNKKLKTTHGMKYTSTYSSWCQMKARCCVKNNPSYQNYGARGINVCDRWLKSFEDFLKDMGEKPIGNYSIERINVNGNYELQNCKWATSYEQTRNYRRNIFIEHDGHKLCLSDWADKVGLLKNTLRARLKAGWPVSKALYTPAKTKYNSKATDKTT